MDTTTLEQTELTQQSINTIRLLAVDAVEKADSGHAGMPMGMAPAAYVLWQRYLKHNPADAGWADRDRFVLSAGHGSMLIYSLLHLTGYNLPMDELMRFRQWKSKTPGHPENFVTDGVETTTGPLGQGVANAVGMAVAEALLAARFNRDGFGVVDHYTYCLCSDGDLMEGISHEACSLAGHLGLGKLIFFYDDNEISIDGSTDLAFTEDVAARFEAYGWHVQHVEDGNDLDAIERAIVTAQEVTERPSIIAVHSIIGYGSPNKQGTHDIHSDALGEEEVALTKRNLGWPEDKTFYVPDGVYEHMGEAKAKGAEAQQAWNDLMDRYAEAHPDLAAEYRSWLAHELPEGWDAGFPTFEPGEKVATRASSGKILDAIARKVGFLVGGSADLTPSNKTDVKGREDFQRGNYDGRYFRFGVREHGMAGASNGIALHGGLRPYTGTFFVFSDYLRPSLRLSALMGAPVIYIFTHDSVGVGEDGPTHQPVEHHMALRAIPDLVFFRPADANEVAEAWRYAMTHTDKPVAFAFTRQGVPTLDQAKYASAEGLHQGAYVLSGDDGAPDVILMATGSEVQHALAAAETLRSQDGAKVRVVSMPSWELFEAQDQGYRDEVLPPSVTKRVSIEAGVTLGWGKYVGLEGRSIGIDRFGASAPGGTVMEKLGITAEHVVREARALLG